jgi:hypothetical protein
MNFELYDKGTFAISETSNIKIFNRYFNNDDAQNYGEISKTNVVLFISDIRNIPMNEPKDEGVDEDVEKNVLCDMNMQLEWIRLMKPHASSLKFRLPYNIDDQFKYLDGYRMLQPYAPFSTEVRLFTDKTEMVCYDCKTFDENMAYFNSSIRNTNYSRWKELFMIGKIKNNWDNTISFYILHEYLKKMYDTLDDDMVACLFEGIVNFLGERYGEKYNRIYF